MPTDFYAALCPDLGPFGSHTDQGDPVAFQGEDGDIHVLTTGTDPERGGAFPHYRTDANYRRWEYVGPCLPGVDTSRHYWAPYVAKNEADGTFDLFYSCSAGPQADVGHFIQRARSVSAGGPYESEGHNYTPHTPFAIDAHLSAPEPDGQRYLYIARNYTEGRRFRGTGLERAPLSANFAALTGPWEFVSRPDSGWMVYHRRRDPSELAGTPLPGVDVTNPRTRLAWYTQEAPETWGDFLFYSGGCYKGALYATGVLRREANGWRNESRDGGHIVLGERPEIGLYVPGHVSTLPQENLQFIGHARYGSRNPATTPRKMFLSPPLEFTPDGLPFCP